MLNLTSYLELYSFAFAQFIPINYALDDLGNVHQSSTFTLLMLTVLKFFFPTLVGSFGIKLSFITRPFSFNLKKL